MDILLFNLFGHWEGDPNGWLRHSFVGILFLLFALATKRFSITFVILLLLAILKETFDAIWGMGYLVVENAAMDILFTLLPFFLLIFKK